MVFRTLPASVLALWLLAGHALGQSSITHLSTPAVVTSTGIAVPDSTISEVGTSTSTPSPTFVSPSLRHARRGLSEKAKTGISVGVTLAAILLVGSITILFVIRRRNKALTKPQTRTVGGHVDEEDMTFGDRLGKGKEEGYYMSSTSAPSHGVFQQAPGGFIYQGEGYPTMPNPIYTSQQQEQQQTYPTSYTAGQPGEAYAHPGTVYPGTVMVDPSQQQNTYAGPSYSQYQPETQLQPQPQHGGDASWVYPISATSTVEPAYIQEYHQKYLQDHQSTHQYPDQVASDYNTYQSADPAPSQAYQEDAYHVPPPHPHASELPDQRPPVEMMGEGHYKEAP
jgi:hypothetical protein